MYYTNGRSMKNTIGVVMNRLVGMGLNSLVTSEVFALHQPIVELLLLLIRQTKVYQGAALT